ncbi:hypothetical protein PIB30_095644 [Stylosanthes scabra]|uniref:Uncharacterized protein n=1 Tax=Stylosanthes scabra TaxID=79078 RepID=A0ABU6YXN5_9FABA|nr:hypothetical protein [Stylosanthes scabra]
MKGGGGSADVGEDVAAEDGIEKPPPLPSFIEPVVTLHPPFSPSLPIIHRARDLLQSHPPPRHLHQRRRSLRRRSLFTNLRCAPSVSAPSVVAPSIAPETTVNPSSLTNSFDLRSALEREKRKNASSPLPPSTPTSVATPSFNPNLHRGSLCKPQPPSRPLHLRRCSFRRYSVCSFRRYSVFINLHRCRRSFCRPPSVSIPSISVSVNPQSSLTEPSIIASSRYYHSHCCFPSRRSCSCSLEGY